MTALENALVELKQAEADVADAQRALGGATGPARASAQNAFAAAQERHCRAVDHYRAAGGSLGGSR